MGVSYIHGSRTTGGSHRMPPLDPKHGACTVCGEKRHVIVTPIGEIYEPMVGTWWHPSDNMVTCSPLCRIMGKYPPGPHDDR